MNKSANQMVGKSKPTTTLVTDPFKIEARLSNHNACGGWKKEFEAAVEVAVTELDGDGFVVEAQHLMTTIRKYFKQSRYIASCEQLAQCITSIVHGMIKQNSLVAINTMVFSQTGFIRVEWKFGDEVPGLLHCEI